MTDIRNYRILEIGEYSLSIINLLGFFLFLLAVVALLTVLKKIIYRSSRLDNAKKFSLYKLLQYTIGVFALLISLYILDFKISILLAGSAALLVGIGFGLQHLFNDFISGIIILLEGILKVDDIIEVNNIIYKVEEINFRTTTVIGRDEDYVILPNSELTSNIVVNWTHSRVSSRFKISLGVDYATDVVLLMKLLKDTAMSHDQVLKHLEPYVRFEEYGDSALIFGVYFFSDEIFRSEQIKSEIRIEIFKILQKHNITIPFPQRVISQRD
jgi:small-conductance mechanosensitive channel